MRIILAVILFAVDTFGAGPGRARKKPGRSAALLQRDEIIRSVFLANTTRSSNEVLEVVAPKLAAVNLKPITIELLKHELIEIAKEFDIQRRWYTLSGEHSVFLKDLFTNDPTLSPTSAWTKFCAAWGPNAEDRDRVVRWWRVALRRENRRIARTARMDGRQSPRSSDSEPPTEWWNLSEEVFDDFLSSEPDADAMRADAASRDTPRSTRRV